MAERFVLLETFLSLKSAVYNRERFQIKSGCLRYLNFALAAQKVNFLFSNVVYRPTV